MLKNTALNFSNNTYNYKKYKNKDEIKNIDNGNSLDINIEQIYLWLLFLKDMNYKRLLDFLKLFKSEQQLYQISKDKILFYNILLNNSFFIPYSLFNDITNLNLKQKSQKIYKFLKFNKYQIIYINSKNYPNVLNRISDPPIAICYNDSKIIDILNSNNLCCIINSNKSNYSQKINTDIRKCISKNGYHYIDLMLNKIDNIVAQNINLNIISSEDNNTQISKIYVANINISEFLIVLCKFLIVIESGYSLYNLSLVDIALEKGLDIISFPAGIYNINFKLNNWLISQGAMCVNCIKEFNNYILEKNI